MRLPPTLACVLAAAVFCTGVTACATQPTDPEALADYRATNDPLEPTNRVFYAINNGIDVVLLKPIALAYRAVLPLPVRTGVHNVLSNLSTPVILSNDLLQGKPRRAGETVIRFVINTTVGVVGIFDVAKSAGYVHHDTDFGITLALWGVPDGPFLFLPVLGPSDPRDAAGFGVDYALDPLTWVGHGAVVSDLKYTRFGTSAVDARAGVLDEIDSVKKTALDPYATFRSLYRQNRASAIAATRDAGAAKP
jgi:phospholipid-binding lipoprotein MlaA